MATRAMKRVEETPKGTSMDSFHNATLSFSNPSSTRIFCTRSGENVSATLLDDSRDAFSRVILVCLSFS